MKTKGIDVSHFQKGIDWTKLKAAGIDFAIIKAGYGRIPSQVDPYFEKNYAAAKAAGIPTGVYWYSYAMSADEAKLEAAACLEVIKGKQFEYPIYFDLEEPNQLGDSKKGIAGLGKDKLTAIASTFLSAVESAGYWVGLYMSALPMQSLIRSDVLKKYAVWVADTRGRTAPEYDGAYGMWQYSWTGKVNGISVNVDLDECYVDYPALIKAKGLNGWTPEMATPVQPETKEISLTIDGATYTGTLTRKEN